MTGHHASPRPTLLVVDDQPTNIQVLNEALSDSYEVLFATSGSKALELSTTRDVDLILLDVVMPGGMDGYEVCRHLKNNERTRGIPVIFVTAMNEVDDETRGFDVGGVDYITKPVSPPKVRARVKTHLELKSTRDLLEELASIDSLTEIANRRRFDEALDQEWHRAARAAAPTTVALVDVDYFKQFNDAYGHARGDDCLKAVARALEATFRRPSDLVARYGGEEFAVVLPSTDFEGACGLVSTLMAEVRRLAIPHSGSTVAAQVTVSVGSVTVVPPAELDPGRLLEEVDQLLYEAKTEGRCRGVLRRLEDGSTRVLGGLAADPDLTETESP